MQPGVVPDHGRNPRRASQASATIRQRQIFFLGREAEGVTKIGAQDPSTRRARARALLQLKLRDGWEAMGDAGQGRFAGAVLLPGMQH